MVPGILMKGSGFYFYWRKLKKIHKPALPAEIRGLSRQVTPG
jgi:hypothetical protein